MQQFASSSFAEKPPTGGAPDEQSLLARALRRTLRPLVRLMLARELNYLFMAEMLKGLFVEVAEQDFRIDGKRQTDARITLLTGVHRKDVKRLRAEPADIVDVIPENISLGAQLIAAWSAAPEFVDGDGHPKPLPRFAQEGGTPSFEALVKSVSKDIHPRAVLDEWQRLGVASIDADNRVYLTNEAFIPEEGYAEKVYYLAQNLHDHVAAAASNVLGGNPSFLERSVYYDGLTSEAVTELADIAEKQGMRALRAVNTRASERTVTDAGANAPTSRMTFGIYFYHEPQAPAGIPPLPNGKEHLR